MSGQTRIIEYKQNGVSCTLDLEIETQVHLGDPCNGHSLPLWLPKGMRLRSLTPKMVNPDICGTPHSP